MIFFSTAQKLRILKIFYFLQYFWAGGFKKISQAIQRCSDEKILCATEIERNFDQKKSSEESSQYFIKHETIGGMEKPEKFNCLPHCKTQDHDFKMSYVSFPSKNTFLYQQSFCHTATKILQKSCSSKEKAFLLAKEYPNLCRVLKDFSPAFGTKNLCQNWPESYFQIFEKVNDTLIEEMFQYGRDNLALVEIAIQTPFVKRIKKDIEMSFTDFLANTGGILGLYLGCSLLSFFEIIYWICCCIFDRKAFLTLS